MMKMHIRYGGNSQTVEAERLGISSETRDDAIKEILSGIYQIPREALRNIAIDRNPDGIVVRPPAVFG